MSAYENPRTLAARAHARNQLRRHEPPERVRNGLRVTLGRAGYQHHEIEEALKYLDELIMEQVQRVWIGPQPKAKPGDPLGPVYVSVDLADGVEIKTRVLYYGGHAYLLSIERRPESS